jgi:Domain of unknown function (DUF4167)
MPSPVNKTMRQGQQHRRSGGRGPKPQNALSRNYESNGPDVKLRGTAAQIAEKYLSLARDALTSGDMVAAESYFQHAEHYNRIVMAAQSQMGVPSQSAGHNGGGGFRPRWNAGVSDRFGNRPGEGNQSGGDGGEISDRRDGGRNMPGLGREHGCPEGGNRTERNHDANGSDQADSPKSDEDGADPAS